MDDTMTIQLGGEEVTLAIPASYALRCDMWMLSAENRQRGLAGALGAAWKMPHRPKVSYAQCRYNPALYGGAVLDELIARGLSLTDIMSAGSKALALISVGLVTEEEVKAAEDFSEDPAED